MEKTLKQRMRDDLELRGFSPHTQKEYLMRVPHFARYFGKLPDKLGEEEVKEYFLHLTRDKHATYGVLNMTYCALKFIYNAVHMVMRSPLITGPGKRHSDVFLLRIKERVCKEAISSSVALKRPDRSLGAMMDSSASSLTEGSTRV